MKNLEIWEISRSSKKILVRIKISLKRATSSSRSHIFLFFYTVFYSYFWKWRIKYTRTAHDMNTFFYKSRSFRLTRSTFTGRLADFTLLWKTVHRLPKGPVPGLELLL